MGERGKPAERVAEEGADEVFAFLETGAALDRYFADQLLLPPSVVPGAPLLRTAEITQHLLTAAEVIRRALPVQIEIGRRLGEPGSVHLTGTLLTASAGT